MINDFLQQRKEILHQRRLDKIPIDDWLTSYTLFLRVDHQRQLILVSLGVNERFTFRSSAERILLSFVQRMIKKVVTFEDRNFTKLQKYVKSTRNTTRLPPTLYWDNKTAYNDRDIANLFKQYLQSVFNKPNEKI